MNPLERLLNITYSITSSTKDISAAEQRIIEISEDPNILAQCIIDIIQQNQPTSTIIKSCLACLKSSILHYHFNHSYEETQIYLDQLMPYLHEIINGESCLWDFFLDISNLFIAFHNNFDLYNCESNIYYFLFMANAYVRIMDIKISNEDTIYIIHVITNFCAEHKTPSSLFLCFPIINSLFRVNISIFDEISLQFWYNESCNSSFSNENQYSITNIENSVKIISNYIKAYPENIDILSLINISNEIIKEHPKAWTYSLFLMYSILSCEHIKTEEIRAEFFDILGKSTSLLENALLQCDGEEDFGSSIIFKDPHAVGWLWSDPISSVKAFALELANVYSYEFLFQQLLDESESSCFNFYIRIWVVSIAASYCDKELAAEVSQNILQIIENAPSTIHVVAILMFIGNTSNNVEYNDQVIEVILSLFAEDNSLIRSAAIDSFSKILFNRNGNIRISPEAIQDVLTNLLDICVDSVSQKSIAILNNVITSLKCDFAQFAPDVIEFLLDLFLEKQQVLSNLLQFDILETIASAILMTSGTEFNIISFEILKNLILSIAESGDGDLSTNGAIDIITSIFRSVSEPNPELIELSLGLFSLIESPNILFSDIEQSLNFFLFLCRSDAEAIPEELVHSIFQYQEQCEDEGELVSLSNVMASLVLAVGEEALGDYVRWILVFALERIEVESEFRFDGPGILLSALFLRCRGAVDRSGERERLFDAMLRFADHRLFPAAVPHMGLSPEEAAEALRVSESIAAELEEEGFDAECDALFPEWL